MFQASFGSDLKGPYEVTVHAPTSPDDVAMLVIRDVNYAADFTIFCGNDALKQFLAIGRAIVEQCERLMAGSASATVDPSLPSAPIKIIPFTDQLIEPEIREINGEMVVDMTGVLPQKANYVISDEPF